MSKKILVTGAGGYIGKNLVTQLRKKDYSLTILVRNRANLPRDFVKDKKIKIVRGDLQDRTSLETAIRNVDIVFHLAAALRMFENNRELYRANILGLKNLLEVCKNENRPIKFIFASSIDVQVRNTDYALSKLKGEKMIKDFCGKTSSIKYVICRIGNVYQEGKEGFAQGIQEIITSNGWKGSVLYHVLGERLIYLLEMKNLMKKLSRLVGDEKTINKTITLFDQKITVAQLIDYFKDKQLIEHLPKKTIFDNLIVNIWQIMGKISKRGDLLIYLGSEK